MAKELFIGDSLSQEMIDAGSLIVTRLDESQADVKAAFWFYYSEEGDWKFVVASPLVKVEGPKGYYKRIVSVNNNSQENENIISLHDISVLPIEAHLIQLLKNVVSTGNNISGVRFSKSTINGTFIDDAYIYRVNL